MPANFIDNDTPVHVSRPSVFDASKTNFMSPLVIPSRSEKKPEAVSSPTVASKSMKDVGSSGVANETKSQLSPKGQVSERRALKMEIRKEIENFKIKSFAGNYLLIFFILSFRATL